MYQNYNYKDEDYNYPPQQLNPNQAYQMGGYAYPIQGGNPPPPPPDGQYADPMMYDGRQNPSAYVLMPTGGANPMPDMSYQQQSMRQPQQSMNWYQGPPQRTSTNNSQYEGYDHQANRYNNRKNSSRSQKSPSQKHSPKHSDKVLKFEDFSDFSNTPYLSSYIRHRINGGGISDKSELYEQRLNNGLKTMKSVINRTMSNSISNSKITNDTIFDVTNINIDEHRDLSVKPGASSALKELSKTSNITIDFMFNFYDAIQEEHDFQMPQVETYLSSMKTIARTDLANVLRGGPVNHKQQSSANRKGGKGDKQQISSLLTNNLSRPGGINTSSKENEISRAYFGTKLAFKNKEVSPEDLLKRKMNALLNKITPENFDKITKEMSFINFTETWQLDIIVGLIFVKAVDEQHYIELYADMVLKISNICMNTDMENQSASAASSTTAVVASGTQLTRVLLQKCQSEFEAVPETLDVTEEEINRFEGDEHVAKQSKRKKINGMMEFIGQLFIRRALSTRVVSHCFRHLLGDDPTTTPPAEHKLEAFICLLKNIGATMERSSDAAAAFVTAKMNDLRQLANMEKVYTPRLRFMIQDLCDLRENDWKERVLRGEAKRISEVRHETRRAQARGGIANAGVAGKVKSLIHNNVRTMAIVSEREQILKRKEQQKEEKTK